jgi:uncharacterized protein (TIGR01777 family)
MHVVVGGASGYVGTELVHQLGAAGHTIVRLVRRQASGPSESRWNPATGEIDAAVIESADAVINLSGASLAKLPWTAGYRRELVSSRLQATSTLAAAISAAATPPSVFLSGSAVGIYGDRAEEDLTESSPRGEGFLADLVEQWEAAAQQVPSGVRVVTLRTGIVVGHGGAFTPLELLTRFGLGAKLGDGKARWPWISLHDEAAAIVHLLTSKLSGPVNLTGPTPATSDAITKRLAIAMKRPRIWTIPRMLISVGLGAAGRELLLPSQRVLPVKLQGDGFVFRDETVETAISAAWPEKA